jgi:UDP-glucose:(heptosyl)LPS alpha-1,3-glucosyltransferase
VVYNGVDIVRFSPANKVLFRDAVREYLGLDRSVTVFLTVANHFALKGVPQAIRAVTELFKEGKPVHLVVLGGRHRFSGWFARHRFRNSLPVTFMGWVDDPTPFYAAADVYLHPTFYDGCSLAVLEAMATGIPVITTRYNGAGEIMEDGQEGFVLPEPSDIRALREKIEILLSPALRTEMGLAAREKAMLFRFEKNVSEILRLYDEVIALRSAATNYSPHYISLSETSLSEVQRSTNSCRKTPS